MQKKYIVRLSSEERLELEEVVKKLKGSSEKVKRAQILLKTDVDGLNWLDHKISEAYGCRRQTVEEVRKRLVTEGFEIALNGKRPDPPRAKLLSGEKEAPFNSNAIRHSACRIWRMDINSIKRLFLCFANLLQVSET